MGHILVGYATDNLFFKTFFLGDVEVFARWVLKEALDIVGEKDVQIAAKFWRLPLKLFVVEKSIVEGLGEAVFYTVLLCPRHELRP